MRIGMTTFMDFMLKSGTPRITTVRDRLRDFEVPVDYYRRVREGISEEHSTGGVARARAVLPHVRTEQLDNYRQVLEGHERWTRDHDLRWLGGSPSAVWTHGELEVIVRPELHLKVDGEPRLIKLYFKDPRPKAAAVTAALHLLRPLAVREAAEPALLDLRRGRLHVMGAHRADVDSLLRAEASAFVSLWNALRHDRAA